MLNKINRIANRKLIASLGKTGEEFKTSHLIFRFFKKESPPAQFAITVSTKLFKGAVLRNHLRQQIAEGLRKNLEHLKTPLLALVIASPKSTKAQYADLETGILKFFNHLA